MCEKVPDEIEILAQAPITSAQKYSSYRINGFDFYAESYDVARSIQSSGVSLVAKSTCF